MKDIKHIKKTSIDLVLHKIPHIILLLLLLTLVNNLFPVNPSLGTHLGHTALIGKN